MDVQPTNTGAPAASDDQALAKVLAGVEEQTSQLPAGAEASASGLQFEETPLTGTTTPSIGAPAVDTPPPASPPAPLDPPAEVTPPAPTEAPTPVVTPPASASTLPSNLETIKKEALEELRPLVDKLDLPAEEKFDTILLIIRSTDDQSLLGAANDAAKAITDEKRRAEALLDIIKEVDYFGHQSTGAA